MAYIFYNPNPCQVSTSDCVIRAIAKALDVSWESAYMSLCDEGLNHCDLPNANHIFGRFLMNMGYRKHLIPNTCPSCYTLRDFCLDHQYGDYVVCTGDHVVTVIDGDYFDSWDSGSVIPAYYYEREVL